jgi:hypothetical protein
VSVPVVHQPVPDSIAAASSAPATPTLAVADCQSIVALLSYFGYFSSAPFKRLRMPASLGETTRYGPQGGGMVERRREPLSHWKKIVLGTLVAVVTVAAFGVGLFIVSFCQAWGCSSGDPAPEQIVALHAEAAATVTFDGTTVVYESESPASTGMQGNTGTASMSRDFRPNDPAQLDEIYARIIAWAEEDGWKPIRPGEHIYVLEKTITSGRMELSLRRPMCRGTTTTQCVRLAISFMR